LGRFLVLALFAFAGVSSSSAQSVPSAIYTDPPADKDHPARMTVLHIPTRGVLMNGLCIHLQAWAHIPRLSSAMDSQAMKKIWTLPRLFAGQDGML